MRILLIGGDGFLGKGLQREFSARNIHYKSLDKAELDVFDTINIERLSYIINDFDNIVILASKLGAQLFETNAVDAANYNKALFDNIVQSIKVSGRRFNKRVSVSYYSTSEVFGSQPSADSYISGNTDYSFDYGNPRHLYSYVKWQAERTLFSLKAEHPEMISSVKIIRPFNIFGRNQKRGVVYDMIKSALRSNTISYRDSTTRTFTDIDFASRMSVDAILSDNDMKVNVVDGRNSLSLKTLAAIISNVLGLSVKFMVLPPDGSIQYRTTSEVDSDPAISQALMKSHILELAEQIRNETGI